MNIARLITKPLLAITPDKEINYKPWHQLGMGALTSAIPVGFIRLGTGSFKSTLPLAIAGLAMGTTALPLHNTLVRYKQQKQLQQAQEAIEKHFFPKPDRGIYAKCLGAKLSKLHSTIANVPDLSKQAGFATNVLNKTKFIGKKGAGAVLKGAAIGATAYGTFKGINYLKKKQPYNYNTMLRNNILAGKIHPAELNSNELQEVKQLGWK
jgi:hypothetical protein